jgi:hypothetical protein
MATKASSTQDTTPEAPKAASKGIAAIEKHAEEAGTPGWLFASTKAYHAWPVGKELTRQEYDAAVDKAANCSTTSLKDAEGKDTSGFVK